MNLLLIFDKNKEKYHYVYIKNISKVMSDMITQNKNNKYVCNSCLQYYTTENAYNKHNCVNFKCPCGRAFENINDKKLIMYA